ncbi:MAG: carboxypeptidase regulatory-like domain-containing protein, partial [Candidatus Thorarchaeota archaeon]
MDKISYASLAIAVIAIIIAGVALALPGPEGPAGQDGADGARGPAGSAGSAGATGPAGQDGADGASTGSILGTVLDAETNEPIEGAEITTEPASTIPTFAAGTETDADGKYTLAVPTGTFTVVALAEHYDSNWETDIFVSPGATVQTDLTLSSTQWQLIKIRGVNMDVGNEVYPDNLVGITLTGGYGDHGNNLMVTSGLSNVGAGSYVLLEGQEVDEQHKDIASWSWSLSSPLKSVAELEDENTQFPRFLTDAVGMYTVSVTVTNVDGEISSGSLDINAGVYSGTSTCAVCHSGSVMPDQYSQWAGTGHSTQFDRQYPRYTDTRDYCVRCHVTGYDETADNGGFDDAIFALGGIGDNGWDPSQESAIAWLKNNEITIQQLMANEQVDDISNIGCESCHGPGGSSHTGALSFEAEVCGQCHHQILEFNQSGHGTGDYAGSNYLHGAESTGCAYCHTGQGFVNYKVNHEPLVFPNMETPSTPANMLPPELQAPITCAACHDPHEATHPEEGQSYQLRLDGEVTTPQGFTVDAHESAACISCHANKRDLQYKEDYIAGEKSRGVHGNPQADVLYGEGAIDYGETFTNSVHTTLVEESCIQCHMYSTIGHGGNEAGGHTWNMVMRNGTENIVSCTQEGCHAVGSITEFDRPANADFDGDGAIEGVQTEVQGLLDLLAAELPQDDDGDVIGSR